MIVELNIKDFAIISNENIIFDSGLNVLTGETGSGKSIIMEALSMLLGSRADRNMIKSGAEKAFIEGLFYIANENNIQKKLEEYGIDTDESNQILITREIHCDGPSINRINGRPVTLSMLNEITEDLVDLHGQHEHQSLLDEKNHIDFVDEFCKAELKPILYNISNKYSLFAEKSKELEACYIDENERLNKLDLLTYQYNELTILDLDSIDEEKLYTKYSKMENLNEIREVIGDLINVLKVDNEPYISVLSLLNNQVMKLNSMKNYDEKLENIFNRFNSIYIDLDDLTFEIEDYCSNLFFDEEDYAITEEKINYIEGLKRKYGIHIEDIISYRNKIEKDILKLENNDNYIEKLKKELELIEKDLFYYSNQASNIRKETAKDLELRILKELESLNMSGVKFKIDFSLKDNFTKNGIDNIRFLISTNVGEDLKPLKDIISGGEMSRIMLAFKNIFAEFDRVNTLVFDEIDSGISGITAQLMGEKLLNISQNRQVITISHLPQIAALADSHFLISKKSDGSTTESNIKKLGYEERVCELSRLLGGSNITNTTVQHAKEMLFYKNRNKL